MAQTAICHAVEHSLAEYEIDEDPTKVLIVGLDEAGNLLEIVVLLLEGDRTLVIHAMPLRPSYDHLLPKVTAMPDRSKRPSKKTTETRSNDALDALAADAEVGYAPERLRPRRGRPLIGSGPADVVPVRLDPALRAAVQQRADADHTSVSEVVREALREHLKVG